MTRRLLYITSLILAAAIFMSSCEDDNPPGGNTNYIDSFIGTWSVSETTGNNAPQFYNVLITRGSSDAQIRIEGLYNEPGVNVFASINGFSITIPQQSIGGIDFASGTGQANANFDQITLDFVANDGTGDDQVSAILTPN